VARGGLKVAQQGAVGAMTGARRFSEFWKTGEATPRVFSAAEVDALRVRDRYTKFGVHGGHQHRSRLKRPSVRSLVGLVLMNFCPFFS
jgi:hypothetical protein